MLRSGVPTSCGDGSRRARVEVVDLVVALVPDPGAVHPPQHVTTAVGPRHPDVFADRQRHRPPRPDQLGGQLDAGRRGSDDQHPTVGQLVGRAVVERGQLPDVGRERGPEGRHGRPVEGAAGQHHGATGDLTGIGPHHVAVVATAHRGDRRPGPHRGADVTGEAADEVDDLAHRHVAVGIGPGVVVAGQPAQPVRRQQPQRVPALGAPGVRDLAAFEHDVVDRPLAQPLTGGQTGVTGPDDDRGDVLDVRRPRP